MEEKTLMPKKRKSNIEMHRATNILARNRIIQSLKKTNNYSGIRWSKIGGIYYILAKAKKKRR
jgi:hypothetical protein